MDTALLEMETITAQGDSGGTFSLFPKECKHCPVVDRENSDVWLDELLGLREERKFLSGVRWFGSELPAMETRAHYQLLRRIFVMVPGAALLANINIAENILLPALTRHVAKEEQVGRDLLEIVEAQGEKLGLPFSDRHKLPHMVGFKQRLIAMILQARLARPEVVILCDASLPWSESWPWISKPCSWLRNELPGTSWLFLNAESGLPAEFSSDTVRAYK
jgi:hypothetical protein